MARALPSPSESVVLVRSLNESLAEHALMRGHRKIGTPATMLVVEGSLKDLPESLSDRLEAARGNAEAPTFLYNEDERICGVKETEGGFCLVGKDGLVSTTFRHVVCAPDTMESPLGQLLRTSSQTGSGASSVSSSSSFGVYELQTQEELDSWMELEEGEPGTGGRWEVEGQSSREQDSRTPEDAEEESDDDEDEIQPLPVSPQLAEDLLTLMESVKEEGGADPEEAEEAEELAGRLGHVCKSREPAVLSPNDVILLQNYFGDYIFHLDEKRRRLNAEGVSFKEQGPIFSKIEWAFAMMGPLVQLAHQSNFRSLTLEEAEQMRNHNDSD